MASDIQVSRPQPINQRKSISFEVIEDTVRQIVRKFKPQRIILFGSYGRENSRPESDVDLLVVMDTPLRSVEQAVEICRSIEYHYGLDLIVITPATLARRLALGDLFLKEVVREGRILYEQPGS